MAISSTFLFKILASLRPEIWELFGGGPQGPILGPVPDPWIGPRSGPFPQPWRVSDPEETWRLQSQLAVVDLTRRLVDAASVIHAQGGDGGGFLRATGDEWGIEGRPPGIRLPAGWWHLVPGPRPPRPNETDILAVLATAGLSFVSLADRIGARGIREAADDVGRRLLDLTAEHGLRSVASSDGAPPLHTANT
jgi:hypothetical protein